jgi:hypothetical protein
MNGLKIGGRVCCACVSMVDDKKLLKGFVRSKIFNSPYL